MCCRENISASSGKRALSAWLILLSRVVIYKVKCVGKSSSGEGRSRRHDWVPLRPSQLLLRSRRHEPSKKVHSKFWLDGFSLLRNKDPYSVVCKRPFHLQFKNSLLHKGESYRWNRAEVWRTQTEEKYGQIPKTLIWPKDLWL